jgi:hypothetical protein
MGRTTLTAELSHAACAQGQAAEAILWTDADAFDAFVRQSAGPDGPRLLGAELD